MRRLAFNIRKLHRWLSLIFGIQLIIWSLSGALMVVLPLNYIHGNHLVRTADQPITEFQLLQRIPDIIAHNPSITNIELVNRLVANELIHLFVASSPNGKQLLNPITGQAIQLHESDIRELAQLYYAPRPQQQNNIETIQLLEHSAPQELSSRHLPVWQVQFNDRQRTTFYLHPGTGELLTKRHNAWRWFDVAWMLHIMDYQDRSDTGKPWAIAFMLLTLVTVFTGLTLLLQRIASRPWRRLWAD